MSRRYREKKRNRRLNWERSLELGRNHERSRLRKEVEARRAEAWAEEAEAGGYEIWRVE